MSSSTTPPTPVDSGECVVCGQITTTRCSSCASHGTKWMYFCSKEHQKLIWFSHKRVCGVNSSPFKWPWLTKEETQEMLKSDLGAARAYGDGVSFGEIAQRRGVAIEKVLLQLDEDANHNRIPTASGIRGLVHIRAIHFDHFVLELNTEDLAVRNRLIGNDPFGLVAGNIGEAWMNRIKDLIESKDQHEWWSRLHHRLLLFFSIICHFYRNGEAYPDPEHPHYVYTRRKVIDILRDEVSQTYPNEALALCKSLDRLAVHYLYYHDKISQSQ